MQSVHKNCLLFLLNADKDQRYRKYCIRVCLVCRMAVDKLKEGIDNFAKDQRKLEEMIAAAATA